MEPSTTRGVSGLLTQLFTLLLLAFAPLSHGDGRAPGMAEAGALTPAEVERDEIFTLLAYAAVRKDWQTNQTDPRRGHNIGSVLVDPDGELVFWARNCNAITNNGSQHGEVRLIRNYLNQNAPAYLKGYTVYTSLEPCAMCSGMMTLTQVSRTVYGQTDPDYGKALERLQLDSSALPGGGYTPYPRAVTSDAAPGPIRPKIERAYADYQAGGGRGLTSWLRSDAAKALYDEAYERFMAYQVEHPENQTVLTKARSYLNEQVTDHYVPLPQ